MFYRIEFTVMAVIPLGVPFLQSRTFPRTFEVDPRGRAQVAVCSFLGDLYLSLEMSVAVIGAGGGCGLEVTKLLLSAGKAVRCIVRDPAKVSPR